MKKPLFFLWFWPDIFTFFRAFAGYTHPPDTLSLPPDTLTFQPDILSFHAGYPHMLAGYPQFAAGYIQITPDSLTCKMKNLRRISTVGFFFLKCSKTMIGVQNLKLVSIFGVPDILTSEGLGGAVLGPYGLALYWTRTN